MSTYTDHLTGTTYTDFHDNKLKETVMISCGYHDLSSKGVTEQLLKLYNPKNEYYGTFRGSIDLCSIPLSGAHLCGATIEDAQLCGSIRLADGIELSSLDSSIKNIIGTLSHTFEGIGDVSEISHEDLVTALSSLYITLKNNISITSTL